MDKIKIYIPGVIIDNARELIRQKITNDPAVESFHEILDRDFDKPELGIITVMGLKCVGVPVGTPDFVSAYMRSKAIDIEEDIHKISIITDAQVLYDLLRFCQHTRLAFVTRNIPPHVMMKPLDIPPQHGHARARVSASGHVHDCITRAILQRGMGSTFDSKSENEK